MNKHIYGIEKWCTQEIIIYAEVDNTTVEKKYFDLNGKLKRSRLIDVTKTRRNRFIVDTQDFMYAMIQHFDYKEIK